MTTLLIVLGIITGYFSVGFFMALRLAPSLWRHAQEVHVRQDVARGNVQAWCGGIFTLWPIMVPLALINKGIDTTDPGARERKIRELEAENRRMELELIREGKDEYSRRSTWRRNRA